MNLTANGELEIWINEAGRDLLVRELEGLSEAREHFHLAASEFGEVEVSTQAYRPSDKVIAYGKVLFRTDEWDRRHYPHVMGATP
jgi:hypothetical protein